MTIMAVVAATVLALASPSPAHAGAPDPDIAQRVRGLTRTTHWTPAAAIRLKFPTFHPQGMVRIGMDFYVSSVEVTTLPVKQTDPHDPHDRTTGAGIGHLFRIGPDGTLLADLVLGEGAMYHPGGIDFDGRSIWVPVSEYRPASHAIVYRIDPATMRVTGRFRVDDHIGAIVRDRADDTLRAVNWGARAFYRWPLGRDGLPVDPSVAHPVANPDQYIDYQDCHYAGDDRMLCSGLGEYPTGPSEAVFQLGGIDLVDLRDDRPLWEAPIALKAPSGRVLTQNPFYLESRAAGLRAYFIPDDVDSTIYIFDAAPTRPGITHP